MSPEELPPAPEGWRVRRDVKGNFFFLTPFIRRTGQVHKISQRRDLKSLIDQGDIDAAEVENLVFKRSGLQKRTTLGGGFKCYLRKKNIVSFRT